MLVQLLSGQVVSYFGELWLMRRHCGGITSVMSYMQIAVGLTAADGHRELVGIWNWELHHRVRPYGVICVLQAC